MNRFIFLLILFTSKLYSQSETLDFIEVSENAKISALGGNNISLYENQNYFLTNPALISFNKNRISINHLNYILDINSSSILYSDSIRYIGNYGIGIIYFSHGKFNAYDIFGNSLGNFYPKEIMITFGKSINLSNLFIGTNIKYFKSRIYNNSNSGILSDIGMIYFPYKEKKLSIGLVIANFGILFNKNNIELPITLKIGTTFKPKYMPLRFSVTYVKPYNYLYNNLHNISFGVEALMSKFINLQIGYNRNMDKGFVLPNSEKIRGFSYGIELILKRFNFNYSKVIVNSISSSNSISIHFNIKRM